MPINQSDVRFRASQRMTDHADGGGQMSSATIVDGADNNLFDDLTDVQRLQGQLSLRKVYGAALNADAAAYLSAHMLLADLPDDAATEALIVPGVSLGEDRADVQARLEGWYRWPTNTQGFVEFEGTAGASSVNCYKQFNGALPSVGSQLVLRNPGEGPEAWSRVSVVSVGVQFTDYLVLGVTPNLTTTLVRGTTSSTRSQGRIASAAALAAEPRAYGASVSTGASSGANVTVASVYAQLVPYDGVTYPLTATGIDPEPWAYADGAVRVLRAADLALIHHTAATSAAAVSNGQTVSVGRTALNRITVVGNSGVEHARFDLGQPAPSGVGCTADLAAGTVTFSDVSGMSQPVTIKHRIEEMGQLQAVDAATGALTFARAPSRVFPAGSVVSSLLMLGDLQGRVGSVFAQQAWTGAWADGRIGGEPTADYNHAGHPVTTTNAGAVTERWAFLFTGPTAYRLVGEQLGEVGYGSTTADFAPLNPATNAPYLAVPAAGWGNGWANGNVVRVNTSGDNAPAWVGRCTNPSVPTASDSVALELRGYTNN